MTNHGPNCPICPTDTSGLPSCPPDDTIVLDWSIETTSVDHDNDTTVFRPCTKNARDYLVHFDALWRDFALDDGAFFTLNQDEIRCDSGPDADRIAGALLVHGFNL